MTNKKTLGARLLQRVVTDRISIDNPAIAGIPAHTKRAQLSTRFYVNDLAADVTFGPFTTRHAAEVKARRLLISDCLYSPEASQKVRWLLRLKSLRSVLRSQLVSITRRPLADVQGTSLDCEVR